MRLIDSRFNEYKNNINQGKNESKKAKVEKITKKQSINLINKK